MGDLKRPLPPDSARVQGGKKRKIDRNIDRAAERPLLLKKKAEHVQLDDLKWNDVSVPDELGDFEGFFGLEEIEGVNVVKHAAGGKVSYQTVKPHVRPVKSDKVTHALGHVYEDHAIRLNDNQEDAQKDEWNGFVDEPVNDDPAHILPKQPSKVKESRPARAARLIRESSGDDAELKGSAFTVLAEEGMTETADVSAWKSLKLCAETLFGLSDLNFSHPTAIQLAAIPHILAGRDLIGKAPTGSGKTLAFGIPIFEHWLSCDISHNTMPAVLEEHLMALIILPTRELAHQINTHLTALWSRTSGVVPRIATLTGGLSIQKQRRLLAEANIVVATPGRLWEVISGEEGVLARVQKIKFLVIDEADRLLSEGHFKDLEEVLTALDRRTVDDGNHPTDSQIDTKQTTRQTLVFSATFSKNLQQKLAKRAYTKLTPTDSMHYLLQKLNFRNPPPTFIDVNPTTQMASTLREGLLECPGTEKDLHLYALLTTHYRTARSLVFVNSISAVRRLVPFLANLNLTAHALHSHMPQKARLRSVERFSSTTIASPADKRKGGETGSILIATDVAARGLDIPSVAAVIHYHLPRASDTYVHRSGRTARAGAPGVSVLMHAPEEEAGLRRLVAQVHAGRRGKAVGLTSLWLDRRVVEGLRPRARLAKMLADAAGAGEKGRADDEWVREAAEDLGIASDVEVEAGGRGKVRREREKAARALTKREVREARAELRHLLGQRINVGISERYLAGGGGVDIGRLLMERNGVQGQFLGTVPGLGFD